MCRVWLFSQCYGYHGCDGRDLNPYGPLTTPPWWRFQASASEHLGDLDLGLSDETWWNNLTDGNTSHPRQPSRIHYTTSDQGDEKWWNRDPHLKPLFQSALHASSWYLWNVGISCFWFLTTLRTVAGTAREQWHPWSHSCPSQLHTFFDPPSFLHLRDKFYTDRCRIH